MKGTWESQYQFEPKSPEDGLGSWANTLCDNEREFPKYKGLELKMSKSLMKSLP